MAAPKIITVCAFALALAAGAPAEAQQAALPPSALVGFGAITGGCGKWASAAEGSVVDIGFLSWLEALFQASTRSPLWLGGAIFFTATTVTA